MNKTLRKAEKVIKRNAPVILSTVGAVGVVATGVMAAKATPKALLLLQQAQEEKNEELLLIDKVIAVAPAYIPATLVGAATIACIFGAHVLNKKQQAALMSAYALLNTSYQDYKNKTKEVLGEEGEKEIRAELAKDKAKEQKVEHQDDGKTLFYDEYSRRYFRATNETVLRAEYLLNYQISTQWGASLNEFYHMVGLDPIDGGDAIGWSSSQMYDYYWNDWIEFWHEKMELEDGTTYYIIHFTDPFPDFEDY